MLKRARMEIMIVTMISNDVIQYCVTFTYIIIWVQIGMPKKGLTMLQEGIDFR